MGGHDFPVVFGALCKTKSERDKNKEVVVHCCALWSPGRCKHCIAAVLQYLA